MPRGAAPGLERSCNRLRSGPASPGLERVEAHLAGGGYAPHRHDTYAVGITLDGVQAFRYRGATRRSLPGELFVLHPDELHDGRPGSDTALRYRILYVDPGLIRAALGGRHALPFVRAAVSREPGLMAAIAAGLDDLDRPLDALAHDAIVQGLADALAAADPSAPTRRIAPPHERAVARARARLDAAGADGVDSAELEALTGLTRYALARHFRACLGTTPHRYLVLRRLDRARALIRQGSPLVEAALASGFADQSHLTRHFKRAYGVPPARWAALTT
jgi:AraC-like DNA-binding protein